MAISALESTHSSSPIRSPCSPIRGASSCRLSLNTSHGNNEKSAIIKTSKSIKLPKDCSSPYLKGDKVHVKSRVTGKSFMSKKEESFTSSFPLAAKIYRANSDEFQNMKRNIKKTKKSVLTLPNVQAPKQQEYTVSDTNDSELFNRVDNHELQSKAKRPIASKKKPASLAKRGSPCSQLFGYSADSSSIEMITHFDGDANRKKKNISDRQNSMYRAKAYDVWTMLRNMNRFQFKPSPAISEESVVTSKKKKVNRKQKYRYDSRYDRHIQTRHREQEIQYISNFEIETLSPSNSFCRASSSGRVTVIDKNDPFEDLCHEFQERIEQIERAGLHQPWRCNKNKRRNKKSPNKNKKVVLKKLQQVDKPVQEKMPVTPYDFPFAAEKSDFSNATSKMTLESEQNVNNSHYNLKLMTKPQTVDTIYTTSKTVNNSKPKTIQNISKNTKSFVNENIKMRKSPIESTDNISGISGITHVVVNKGTITHTLKSPLRSVSPRSIKSRPNTTSRYLNSATVPSQTLDVKRRLARLKFPITILGRDQVSSSYEVVTFDAPQFESLSERIWPFMADWYSHKNPKDKNSNRISRKVNRVLQYCWYKKPDEDAKWKASTSHTSMQKRKDDSAKVNSGTNHYMQRTPMAQFKDKMLKFLHKNPANNRVQTQTTDTEIIRSRIEVDSSINVKSTEQTKPSSLVLRSRNSVKRPATLDSIIRQANIKVEDISLPIKTTKTYDLRVKQNFNGKTSKPNQKPLKKPGYTWTKASQASNFIDNVISKIKTGVYCNHVNGFTTEPLIEVNETIQPNNTASSSTPATLKPYTTENKKINDEATSTKLPASADNAYNLETEPLKTFNGFDETFPGLEVETINKNRVAIKNCIINILVHFDIAAPAGLKKSPVVNEMKPSSCVPVTVSNNKTQIFKCTTTIVNAILPAELCTLLPNMMRNILLGPKSFPPDISHLDANKSQLSVITEISKGESHFFDALLFTSTMEWSTELHELVCGRFNTSYRIQTKKTPAFDFRNIHDLLLPLPSPLICISNQTDFRSFCFTVNGINRKKIKGPKCTALVPYNPPCQMLTNLINRTCFTQQVITFTGLDTIINQVSRIPFEFITIETCDKTSSTCTALVKYVKPLRIELLERLNQNNALPKMSRSVKKLKRKGFVRHFRRCKSTSNLTKERCVKALNKITNLEEFLRALGSGKTLCSAFDKATEGKILKCIVQMKNWISKISPRQTLLVLLLMIKKETPNMVKLMPIILQAIAANRITKTSELDMEIEVIERESFNKASKYEGIYYLPASCENNDSLMEELSWIAKTTASDYQKTFDESSERLLKSLLDKRKKLNPSYLRVMARYVGLGLLKTPK